MFVLKNTNHRIPGLISESNHDKVRNTTSGVKPSGGDLFQTNGNLDKHLDVS